MRILVKCNGKAEEEEEEEEEKEGREVTRWQKARDAT